MWKKYYHTISFKSPCCTYYKKVWYRSPKYPDFKIIFERNLGYYLVRKGKQFKNFGTIVYNDLHQCINGEGLQ